MKNAKEKSEGRNPKAEERASSLPALMRMQRLQEDRMMRSGEAVNRLPRNASGEPDRPAVRAALKWEGPSKLAHYHD